MRDPGAVEARRCASRSLSSRPSRARTRSPRDRCAIGMNAAMPPIAWAPRRWQVLTSSSRVGAHERHGHRHLDAIGEDEVRAVAELLDDAEDVVPAPAVEPARRARAARRGSRPSRTRRGSSRSARSRGSCRCGCRARSCAQMKTSFQSRASRWRLQLRQVEVRPGAARRAAPRVVEEVEPEVEQARAEPARRRPSDVLLDEVPAARADEQRRGLRRSARSASPPARRTGSCRAIASRRLTLALDACSPRSASSRPRSRP